MRKDLLITDWITLEDENHLEKENHFVNGFLHFGESINYDFPNTVDCREYDGIAFDILLPVRGEVEFQITILPLKIARPEFFPKTEAKVTAYGEGMVHVEVDFHQFDYLKMVGAFLKYVSSIQLCCTPKAINDFKYDGITMKNVCLKKLGDFHIYSNIVSKMGDPGAPVSYEITLENETEEELHVKLYQERYARETMLLDCPEFVILQPLGKKEVHIKVIMTEDIPLGGYEEAYIRAVPNGNAAKSQSITLTTSRRRNHPYLMHTEEGWQKVREKIERNKDDLEACGNNYIKVAEEWEVPVPSSSVTYVYPAYSQNPLRDTAIAWKLTGKKAYALKCVEYLRGLVDDKDGYLATEYSYFQFIESYDEYEKADHKVRRACSAGWIQEAEFFIQLTIVYDLLCDSGYLEDTIHRGLEKIFQNYMYFTGWRLTDGDGNNFQIAEMTAGLFCAYLLQDYHWIQRFIYGENGFCDLLSSVLYDDGVYFEEATSYMRLTAEVLFEVANGSQNFGINLKDMLVPACYDKHILHSPWAMRETWSEDGKPFLGMSFQRFQLVTNPVRTIKQYYDVLLLLLNNKGVMLSMNDSNEHYFYEVFERAYYLFRDERYAAVIKLAPSRSLIYGVEDLPKTDYELGKECLLLTAAGLGVLRGEDTLNGKVRKSQAVLKFGPHGGYHGHFDRLSLQSFIKEDDTFHNMEYTWYGYDSFLFKMWVQISVAHNMVTVDLKMQEPVLCEPVLYYNGKGFQAVCAQTTSRWSDPPYGGQTPYLLKFPEEKCNREGRYILTPETPREQGGIGEYTDPVFQRRLLILTEGYCLIWDYERSDKEHDFDCLYHPKGSVEVTDGRLLSTTERFCEDPYGAGQFVTNCNWYQVKGTAHLHFENNESQEPSNNVLSSPAYIDIYRAYPQEGTVVIGKFPEKDDTFTAEDIATHKDHMNSSSKKTVSFRVRGREARLVTVLETGQSKGHIRKVTANVYNQITIEQEDGVLREFTVSGMEQVKKQEVKIMIKIYRDGKFEGQESSF